MLNPAGRNAPDHFGMTSREKGEGDGISPHSIGRAARGLYRVVVTRRLPPRVEERLAATYQTILRDGDRQMSADELRAALQDADVVLCTLTDRLTREVLLAEPRRARLLANFGVGFDHIDLAAAREADLVVTNTPGVLTEDTADLTMLLVLAIARRATEGERELRAGAWTGWRPTHLLGRRVNGATLGIVGFGRIGQAVAQRAHAGFGMRVLYYSRSAAPDDIARDTGAVRCDTLDALLEASDVVSIHVPATRETRALIDAAALAHMKRTAFLINTSRGGVVDETALVRALHAGTLAGAALDVYENEPHVSPAILAAPNVVALPHLGSATEEARVAMGMRAVDNIDAFVSGGEPPDRIA
jgi:lactate dehydrogenase-like 2-hydroxyacid dehydrogenase